MKHNLVLFALLVLTSMNSVSQKLTELAFVKNAAGNSKLEFSPKTIPLTSKFGLTDIAESNSTLEIRLYETYPWRGLSYCTLLSFDKAAKLTRIKYLIDTKTKKQISTETIATSNLNADSILKVVVQNGLLNFISERNHTISDSEYNANDIPALDRKIYFGGVSYIIEYKANDKYNRLWWNNPQFYLKEFPNNVIFKKQNEIVTALGVGRKIADNIMRIE